MALNRTSDHHISYGVGRRTYRGPCVLCLLASQQERSTTFRSLISLDGELQSSLDALMDIYVCREKRSTLMIDVSQFCFRLRWWAATTIVPHLLRGKGFDPESAPGGTVDYLVHTSLQGTVVDDVRCCNRLRTSKLPRDRPSVYTSR